MKCVRDLATLPLNKLTLDDYKGSPKTERIDNTGVVVVVVVVVELRTNKMY